MDGGVELIAVDNPHANKLDTSRQLEETMIMRVTHIFGSLRVIKEEAAGLLRIDVPAALIVVLMLLMFLPTITRYASDAALLHTFVDDEPLITMQLDGMTAWPWGDPSTYLDPNKHAARPVPAHWLNIRYDGIVYYGGLYPDLGLLVWAPLKAMGFDIFPTGPVLLRAISLLFSIFTLLAVYNFGRRYFGLFAGLFGALFLLTEFHFFMIGTIVHPDSLLFFLTLLALPISIRHAKDGATDSLVAIGIVAGLAQGAKMGGPLLAPIAIVSIVYGARDKAEDIAGFVRVVFLRGLAVSIIAVIVFFLTTPYAALDPYYLSSWRGLAKLFTGPSPIEHVTFFTWLSTFVSKMSVPLLVASGMAIGAHCLSGRNLTLALTALLSASVFIWYALFQRFWVQPQYLIVSYALVAIIGWSLVDRLILLLPAKLGTKPIIAFIAVCSVAVAAVMKQDRIDGALTIPLIYFGWRDATQYQVGAWLSQKKQGQSTVLFDTQAYFDPSNFPRQFPSGGPVHWTDLARVKPDYFALTVYGSWHWMGQKMAQQHSEQWDPDYYNMRLYQDLLGTNPDDTAATNSIPYISAIQKFAPLPVESRCENGKLFSRSKIVCLANATLGDGIGPRGPTIWLFKLDPAALRIPHQLAPAAR